MTGCGQSAGRTEDQESSPDPENTASADQQEEAAEDTAGSEELPAAREYGDALSVGRRPWIYGNRGCGHTSKFIGAVIDLPGVAGLNTAEHLRFLYPGCGLFWCSDMDLALVVYFGSKEWDGLCSIIK